MARQHCAVLYSATAAAASWWAKETAAGVLRRARTTLGCDAIKMLQTAGWQLWQKPSDAGEGQSAAWSQVNSTSACAHRKRLCKRQQLLSELRVLWNSRDCDNAQALETKPLQQQANASTAAAAVSVLAGTVCQRRTRCRSQVVLSSHKRLYLDDLLTDVTGPIHQLAVGDLDYFHLKSHGCCFRRAQVARLRYRMQTRLRVGPATHLKSFRTDLLLLSLVSGLTAC